MSRIFAQDKKFFDILRYNRLIISKLALFSYLSP